MKRHGTGIITPEELLSLNAAGNKMDRPDPRSDPFKGYSPRLEWFLLLLALAMGLILLIARPSKEEPGAHKSFLTSDVLQRINLGVIYMMEGYVREAAKHFRTVPEGALHPLRSALLGIVNSARGKKREALEFYAEADWEAGKTWIPALLRRYEEGERSIREESLEEDFRDLDPDSLYISGLWLMVRGLSESGIDLLERSFQGGFNPLLGLAALSAAKLQAGQYGTARSHAIELSRDKERVEGLLLHTLTELGLKKYNSALDALNKVPRQGSLKPAVLNLKGRTYMEEGSEEAAEKLFFGALALEDDFDPAHVNLAALYTRQGRLQSARYNFDRADVSGGYGIRTLWIQAELLEAEGDREAALLLWKRILSIDPDRRGVQMNIGYYHIEQGEHHKALALFEKIEREQGESPSILKGVLAAAEGLGNKSKILSTLKRLDALVPGDSEIQLRLIEALQEFGSPREAEKYLSRGINDGTLSTASLLAYLDKAAQGPYGKGRELVGDIVIHLVRHPSVTKEALYKAKEILLKPRADGQTIWRPSQLQALAGRAVILSGGKDMNAVIRLIKILDKTGKYEEAKEILDFFLMRYPKNRQLKLLLDQRIKPKVRKKNAGEEGG